jgi:hypothetical protein
MVKNAIQSSLVLGLNGHILVTLKLDLMFCSVKDWSKALSTYPTSVIFYDFWYLFLPITASLSFLNVILNGLKHETSRAGVHVRCAKVGSSCLNQKPLLVLELLM